MLGDMQCWLVFNPDRAPCRDSDIKQYFIA